VFSTLSEDVFSLDMLDSAISPSSVNFKIVPLGVVISFSEPNTETRLPIIPKKKRLEIMLVIIVEIKIGQNNFQKLMRKFVIRKK
jgi:hypothetical protein